MNKHYPCSLFLLATLLAGCASLPTQPAQIDEEIAKHEEQHEYEQALRLITHISPQNPEYSRYATKRKEIEEKIQKYSQNIITKATQLLNQERWAEALDLYDEALGHVPSHSGLRDSLAQLHQKQEAAADAEYSKILIARGYWLEQLLPVTRKIATILPRDKEAQKQLQQREREAQQVAIQLAKLGDEAMDKADYDLADQTLTIAARLSGSESIEQSLNKLKAVQTEEEKSRQRAAAQKKARQVREEQQRKEKIQRLSAKYNKAFNDGQYLEARQHLKTLAKLKPAELPIDSMIINLEKTILDTAEKRYQEGASLYSRNQFEAALKKWEETLALNPKHLLAQENAERARKVVRRLQELRNQ